MISLVGPMYVSLEMLHFFGYGRHSLQSEIRGLMAIDV